MRYAVSSPGYAVIIIISVVKTILYRLFYLSGGGFCEFWNLEFGFYFVVVGGAVGVWWWPPSIWTNGKMNDETARQHSRAWMLYGKVLQYVLVRVLE